MGAQKESIHNSNREGGVILKSLNKKQLELGVRKGVKFSAETKRSDKEHKKYNNPTPAEANQWVEATTRKVNLC